MYQNLPRIQSIDNQRARNDAATLEDVLYLVEDSTKNIITKILALPKSIGDEMRAGEKKKVGANIHPFVARSSPYSRPAS